MYISYFLFYKSNGDGTSQFKVACFGTPERERSVSKKLEAEDFLERRIDRVMYDALTTQDVEVIR